MPIHTFYISKRDIVRSTLNPINKLYFTKLFNEIDKEELKKISYKGSIPFIYFLQKSLPESLTPFAIFLSIHKFHPYILTFVKKVVQSLYTCYSDPPTLKALDIILQANDSPIKFDTTQMDIWTRRVSPSNLRKLHCFLVDLHKSTFSANGKSYSTYLLNRAIHYLHLTFSDQAGPNYNLILFNLMIEVIRESENE